MAATGTIPTVGADIMTIIEAIENALEAIEEDGMDRQMVLDDLKLAIRRIRTKHRTVGEEEL